MNGVRSWYNVRHATFVRGLVVLMRRLVVSVREDRQASPLGLCGMRSWSGLNDATWGRR